MEKRDTSRTTKVLKILLIIMVAIIIIAPIRSVGYISKLKYASFENFKKVPGIIIESEDKVYIENEEELKYKERMNEIASYMIKFVKDEYSIDLILPDYILKITSDEHMSMTNNNNTLIIAITESKIENDPNDYEVLFIHELFHLLSCQNGKRTRMCPVTDFPSAFSEGYTDMLTDKFLDYMGWDNHIRLRQRSMYFYFRKFLDCIFIEEGKDLQFAKYYFLDDFSFYYEFNNRTCRASLASILYFPYRNIEMHAKGLIESNYESKEDFLIMFELLSYYASTMGINYKKEVEEYFYEIEDWANNHINGSKDIDYSYFHEVLYQNN